MRTQLMFKSGKSVLIDFMGDEVDSAYSNLVSIYFWNDLILGSKCNFVCGDCDMNGASELQLVQGR